MSKIEMRGFIWRVSRGFPCLMSKSTGKVREDMTIGGKERKGERREEEGREEKRKGRCKTSHHNRVVIVYCIKVQETSVCLFFPSFQ